MHRSEEIAKRVPHDRTIIGVEVGVRYGKNAEHLLEQLPNLKLTLVDRWEKPPVGDSYYQSGDGIADRPKGHHVKTFAQTKERMKRFPGRAWILKMGSIEATDALLRQGFAAKYDFVFLDADHSYEGVRTDIMAWLYLVKPGGLICGHDYGHPRIGEVKRAVDGIFKDSIELGSDMTWFFRVQ